LFRTAETRCQLKQATLGKRVCHFIIAGAQQNVKILGMPEAAGIKTDTSIQISGHDP
jgi:hypothetical protein